MDSVLKRRIKEDWNYLPLCSHYAELLKMAKDVSGCSDNNVREICGNWTYAQWHEFFDRNNVTL